MSLTDLPAAAWLTSADWIEGAGRLLAAILILAAGFVAARLVRLFIRRVRNRTALPMPSIYIVEKLATYGLVAAGGFVAFSTLGVNLTSLAVFAGAVGVGVGLGLQGVVREFVSGLVVIFDANVHVGDFVELENGVRGEIVEVGPRATRIRTNDALDVVLPNSKLIESQVINWTLKGETRRIHVPFSVAYGADKALVRDAVLAAAREVPFTLETETRRTQVWLVGFGDSAMNFELVVWPTPEAARRPAAMHAAYTWAIDDALCKAGVEIPFQQLDIRLRSLFGHEGEAALEALKLRAPAEARPSAGAAAPNDALQDAQVSAGADDPEGRAPVEPRAQV
jgi:small-conductance mechanosensitive channel